MNKSLYYNMNKKVLKAIICNHSAALSVGKISHSPNLCCSIHWVFCFLSLRLISPFLFSSSFVVPCQMSTCNSWAHVPQFHKYLLTQENTAVQVVPLKSCLHMGQSHRSYVMDRCFLALSYSLYLFSHFTQLLPSLNHHPSSFFCSCFPFSHDATTSCTSLWLSSLPAPPQKYHRTHYP